MASLAEERGVSLPQHEEAFLATFALTGFGVGHLSFAGKWTMVSQRLCEIVGYGRRELLDKSFYDILHSEESSLDLIDSRVVSGAVSTWDIEKQIRREDGRTVWIKAVIAPVRDEDTREPRYLFAVIEDITEQKNAQHDLKQQAQFNELMTRVLTAFTVCSNSEVNARVTDALGQLAEFVGVDHAHVIIFTPDRTTWSATHEWRGAGVAAQIKHYRNVPFGAFPWSERKLLAGETIRIGSFADYPPEAKAELQSPDVEAGSLSLLLVPIRGVAGAIAGCVGLDSHARPFAWSDSDVIRCQMVGDAIAGVLERRKAEQALRESEERFRAMADSVPIMMWMSGTDKACTDFNRGWLEFTGRSLEQEMGAGWSAGVHPDDMIKCLHTYVTAFDERRSFSMEYRLRRHDGEYRWISDSGFPRFLPDGSFAGYIGCCLDISDQVEMTTVRRELAGRLMSAQEAERSRIARELHDDIGQSLALLGIQLQRATQARGRAGTGERADVAELGIKVKEIGTKVSRLSYRLHPVELEYLGLAVAVQGFCREFAEQSRIPVECQCEGIPEDLDGNISLCFLRVIQEALQNVAKHSKANSVKVQVRGAGRELTLLVVDDGCGFQVDESTRRPGLGLISMRERMYLVGGELEIDAQAGRGTAIRGRAPIPVAARTATA